MHRRQKVKKLSWLTVLGMLIILFSCGKKEKTGQQTATGDLKQAEHIEVQHILIAFKGSIRKPNVTRTQEEAKTLAYEVFQKAQQGEDFDQLVQKYTDDQYPGKYKMSNKGVTPTEKGEYPRTKMVPAFGDVGFKLVQGEVGIADYDPQTSPFGWHIIKRVR